MLFLTKDRRSILKQQKFNQVKNGAIFSKMVEIANRGGFRNFLFLGGAQHPYWDFKTP